MQLLIPMSGQGTRYQKAGFEVPKPLIDVNGKPMIERLLDVMPERWNAHFVMAENHRVTALPEKLKALRPRASVQFVEPHTLGPGHAIEKGLDSLPDDDGILVSYCDYGMVWDPNSFENFVTTSDCDACLVSYRGHHAHYVSLVPYAYSRMDGERVVEVKEKGSFTSHRELEWASCGAYYFKNKRVLRKALEAQRALNLSLNGEFYTSLTVQALLQSDPAVHVRVFEIPYFFQWGTPEDLVQFRFWEKSFENYSRFLAHSCEGVSQLLLPMAGFGSRFAALTAVPKPLLPMGQSPLFRRAISPFSRRSRKVFVGLESFRPYFDGQTVENEEVMYLSETPRGQALTTEKGLSRLSPDSDLIVTACDHMPVINPRRWKEFLAEKNNLDAVVFTQRGFPEVQKTPHSYAYVEEIPPAHELGLPQIRSVSVKKPLSSSPLLDAVLVGSFWFRNPKIVADGIRDLLEQNLTVNGEFYLDSVINLLIEKKMRIKAFPLDGFICWGTPELAAQALYYEDAFLGRSSFIRPRFQFSSFEP